MTYNVVIFGIKLKLSPVAFSIPLGRNHWDVYWYGIIIAVGFLLAVIYGIKNASRYGINADKMLDVILVATPVAILSARTYYIVFDGEKLGGIGDFFGFGNSSGFSGLAIYGGVIGAFLSGALMCRVKKIKILDMFDLAATGFLIGQGIGRWGNFVNQEAYGSLTGSSWWGMQSERTVSEIGAGLVHPCFLYESVWCIAGFFILNSLGKKRKFSGEVALLYCVWYGFGRGFIELLRTDSLMLGSIKISCLLSFTACIAAATALVVIRRKTAVRGDYTPIVADETANQSEEYLIEEPFQTADGIAQKIITENEEDGSSFGTEDKYE